MAPRLFISSRSPRNTAASGGVALIQAANYEEHLALLGDCDLVIEAIAERMDWKLDLYRKVGMEVTTTWVNLSLPL